MADKFFEDLKVGEIYKSGTETLSQDDIINFAKQFDPQPMHTDPEKAKDSLFGRLVGSGWQSLSASIRMLVESKVFGNTPLIGVNVDNVRFWKPLLPGATIQVIMEIQELIPSSKPERGYVVVKVTTQADGEDIVTQNWRMLIPTRAHQKK
ncbi:MAG: enoyl-CoA hydratase [Magnetococcales bacterium]|nr:enoyl-CoA hydratase [Magnetococcales bacterium]MEC8066492.1 MaoC/PaaZ C-terminal domain-containing protein [Pseudomonadota bacterium]|tara:strand:- start:12475 stop:12927 length:453 start_codon:yes stop_codon:yes gene_type:complete